MSAARSEQRPGQAFNHAAAILGRVLHVVSNWPDHADRAKVRPDQRDRIANALRRKPFK